MVDNGGLDILQQTPLSYGGPNHSADQRLPEGRQAVLHLCYFRLFHRCLRLWRLEDLWLENWRDPWGKTKMELEMAVTTGYHRIHGDS